MQHGSILRFAFSTGTQQMNIGENNRDADRKPLLEANNLRDQGEFDAAIGAYKKLIENCPDCVSAHCELGITYVRKEMIGQAESCFRQVLHWQPAHSVACNHLGIILARRGENHEAETAFRNALTEDIDCFDVHVNLGNLLRNTMRRAEALYHYRRALQLYPASTAAKQELGHLMYDLGQTAEAMALLKEVVVAEPELAAAWINLSRCHIAFQELDEVEQCCLRAIPLHPRQFAPWDNLLLASNWRSGDREQIFRRHLEFGEHLLEDWNISPRTHFDNPIDSSRRLRIGFVSGDFRHHSVSYFIEAALTHLDRAQFEAWAYYNHALTDSRSDELRQLFDEWRCIHGVSATDAARIIAGDGIDILIDLSGHTALNRLDIFAHKPSPVQVSWIGYPNTTGLKAIDYRITDALADPPGLTEQFHSETLWRLPDCFLCYTPPRNAPAITESPVNRTGYITFGSFNARVKISDDIAKLWSEILTSVKGSRLLIKSVSGTIDETGKSKLIEQLQRAGIDPTRIGLLAPQSGMEEHLSCYGDVDIALDTYPYNGTTTTCEALWMGVPVVTLTGDRHSARVGGSLLKNCGLGELVAETPDDYIRIATDLAFEPNRLAVLRAASRQRMLASPLLDAVTSTRHLEQALRMMWINFCKSRVSIEDHRSPPIPDTLELEVSGGHKISVAVDPLHNMTSWVLLEQEDWFEDDIRFLRSICQPTWCAFDVGANHGVYALALAASGAKAVWAFEPVSGPRLRLRNSIRLNGFEAQINVLPLALSGAAKTINIPLSLHTELNSLRSVSETGSGHEQISVATLDDVVDKLKLCDTRIDFVKLDAEREEPAILRGGMRFFSEQSPLVMFERPDSFFNSELIGLFRALGYSIFRLVPGLSCLLALPDDTSATLDSFDLNLYACKPDRANDLKSRELLVTESLANEIPLNPAWSDTLHSLPSLLSSAPAQWKHFDYSTDYGQALLAWCGSRQTSLAPEVRLRLLMQGLAHLQGAIDGDDAHPAVAILGIRLCADAGMRSQALAIAAAFLAQMSNEDELSLDRPLPPAYQRFDQIRPQVSLASFLCQSVVEFNLDRSRHSTVFGGGGDTDFESGLENPEHTTRFERTAVLCQARDGFPLCLNATAKLFSDSPENRNAWFWRNAAEGGQLCSLNGQPPWRSRATPSNSIDVQSREQIAAMNRIIALEANGDAHTAFAEAEIALQSYPQEARLLNIAAAIARSLKNPVRSESLWQEAIRAEPNYADPYANLGLLLAELERFEEAEAFCRRALELDPGHTGALCNLGAVLMTTGRLAEAEDAFTRALGQVPAHAEALNNLGLLLKARGDLTGAELAYKKALDASPGHARAYNNLGVLLLETKRHDLAESALRQALQNSPNYAEAHNNLGLVLMQTRRADAAEVEFRLAIQLNPDDPSAQMNLGVLTKEAGRYIDAETAFRRALELSPDCGNAAGEAYFCARYLCDWTRSREDEVRLIDMVERGISDISPFVFLTFENPMAADMPALQKRAAELYARDSYQLPRKDSIFSRPNRTDEKRLRIGYLSADFHHHPTMHLLRGVLKAHDRSRFAVHAYSYGSIDDYMTEQARAACEVFRDIGKMSDLEAANAIAADGIDILVDLKGFTFDTRLEISALRPVPVIVSWLGYPGSLGHPQLADFVIGDPVVTPKGHSDHFSERILQMPHCYQPNDRERIAAVRPTRAQAGLPEDSFVFCCFNSSYKISSEVFDTWCQLLQEIPTSVLWLLEPPRQAISNLLREASRNQLESRRIIFAPAKPLAEHLGRLQLADLALDTFPYTSHTTASDALWAGVPLITRIGETFASRVAASLLRAIGLSELITTSRDEYLSLARGLANSPESLGRIRAKIDSNRLTTPLFDTMSFTNELETLYANLWNAFNINTVPK